MTTTVRRYTRIVAGVLAMAAMAGCGDSSPRVKTDEVIVQASPERGFNYPYILRIPRGFAPDSTTYLLVEPNNTGKVSDDLNVHMDSARKTAVNAIGGYVSRYLSVPLLVPVFPRPESQWQIYTHILDRDVMLLADDPMGRPDEQLIAMIEDARVRLRAYGAHVDRRVLMTGFSASGSYANRFTLLHPDRVRAVSCGGVNGLLMLPLSSLDGTDLRYPLGIADYDSICGRAFDRDAWLAVPQFVCMGAMDTNDAVDFDDGYSESERAVVHTVIGRRMQPDRWEKCQAVYRDAGAHVTFRTYEGIGHGTNEGINREIAEFFRTAIEGP